MSLEMNKELVNRFYEEFWKNRNYSIADEVFAKDVIIHRPMPGFESNPVEGLKFLGKARENAFSEGQGSCMGPIAEDDLVSTYWKFNGVLTGELMGVKGTGQTIHTSGIEIFRIRDGKIVEMWHHENLYEMMMQLGLIPQSCSSSCS
jgi:predicted ester cyclase